MGRHLSREDKAEERGGGNACPDGETKTWPLHNIAITNIVWCMAYNRGVGGGRILSNGRAMVLQ